MTIDVVSCDEVFFMLLLRGNYVFESPSLYDDGGYCVSSWKRGVRSTRYELCFWKPVVGEERAYLGWAITGCFQTRYGFCFFQLRGRCEKAEPVPGSFHASIFPHVGSLRSPTWGFQKYNSYRVANMENETCTTNIRLSRAQLFHAYRWQWMLCCAMRAMLGYPDFRSYEWQRILCYAMRHFSCSNCIAVMLLKARGWRGTSLPRGSENAWFSTPVRVLFLPIMW